MSMRKTCMRKTPAFLRIIAGLLALGWAGPAAAQLTQQSPRLVIMAEDNDGGYRPAKSKTYAAVRDRVIKARLLERLRDFLSPVRLPRSVGALGAGIGHDDHALCSAFRCSSICRMVARSCSKSSDVYVST